MPIESYRGLEVYQRAKALVVPIHQLVTGFPAHERFDLCDQIRRASKSVVANIVEGYSHKDTPGKAKQFWRIAMGSANEMVEHLETAAALGYASQDTCQPYIEQYIITAKQLKRVSDNWFYGQLFSCVTQASFDIMRSFPIPS